MQARFRTCALVGTLLASATTAHAQTALPPAGAPELPTMPTVALSEVAVRATPRQLTLRAPGEAKGLHDALAHSLAPGDRRAVWHPHPDSAHAYRIRAVRVRLGSRLPATMSEFMQRRRRFPEGRLELRLSPATATGAPAETNLLAAPIVITPEASNGHEQGWLRFEVAEQRLLLPAGGLFVVATGLTTNPNERLVRHRMLTKQVKDNKPPRDLDHGTIKPGSSARVYSYEEIQPAGGSSARLVPSGNFPAIAHRGVESAAECRSWQWFKGRSGSEWKSLRALNEEWQRFNSGHGLRDYNYDLELEVEEL